jgi:polyphosphate kinase 2 (PPK2 family)
MGTIKMENTIKMLKENISELGNRKIAFVLEGRDASGKGGFVKLLLKHDIPFVYRHQGMPTKTRMKKWLSDYERIMPKKGEIVIFDRSWHTRSWVHPVFNYCTKQQYINHMRKVAKWENKMETEKNIEIYKNWISISKERQSIVLENRKINKPYKYTASDALAIDYFEAITNAKEIMFSTCPTWNIVKKDTGKIELLDALIRATG